MRLLRFPVFQFDFYVSLSFQEIIWTLNSIFTVSLNPYWLVLNNWSWIFFRNFSSVGREPNRVSLEDSSNFFRNFYFGVMTNFWETHPSKFMMTYSVFVQYRVMSKTVLLENSSMRISWVYIHFPVIWSDSLIGKMKSRKKFWMSLPGFVKIISKNKYCIWLI